MRGKNTPQEKIDKIISKRKEGYSYSDLQREFKVGKATLSTLLKGIKLDNKSLLILEAKRYKNKYIAIRNWDESKKWAESVMGEISERDKLFILSMLYWGEGTKKELNIINGDPALLKVFLYCLRSMGIEEKDIVVALRIFDRSTLDRTITFWAKTLNVPRDTITRFEFVNGTKSDKLPYGMCRIRIRKSALYFKKIMSMITYVKECFN